MVLTVLNYAHCKGHINITDTDHDEDEENTVAEPEHGEWQDIEMVE